MLSRAIYYISTHAYFLGIRIAALWNRKAKRWIALRRDWVTQAGAWKAANNNKQVVWMHCSSLGEFEQGKPLLDAVKKQYPAVKTVVSFFSPSGYDAIAPKNHGYDWVTCLPADTRKHAEQFISLVQPSLVLWVKYEFWFHYLDTLRKRNIPAILFSAVFRNGQPFFKWYGNLWLKMLHCFTQIFVRDEDSQQAIAEKGIDHVQVSGDTRFDRVTEILAKFEAVPGIAEFCTDDPTIVAGSTWEEDEEELTHFIMANPRMRFIIAPHEIDEAHLRDIEKLLKNTVRYSQLLTNPGTTANVLLIDNIGMLSRLYNYATVSYVGGGFGHDGVHNILEPAVYGRPVVFGPVYEKYREAAELIEAGGAFSIENALELENTMDRLLAKHDEYINACDASRKYVLDNSGTMAQIMEYIHTTKPFDTKA